MRVMVSIISTFRPVVTVLRYGQSVFHVQCAARFFHGCLSGEGHDYGRLFAEVTWIVDDSWFAVMKVMPAFKHFI